MENQLATVNIPGDGNCLFRAIAHQINDLFGVTFDYKAIRRDLARYADENQQETNMRHAIMSNLNDDKSNVNEQIRKYLKSQYSDGVWGGADILISAAEYYSINVKVFQGIPLREIACFTPKISSDAVGTIGLIYTAVIIMIVSKAI